MITLELLQKMWDMITPPEKDKVVFEARQIDSIETPNGSPLLTIDIEHHRHLLIPIKHNFKVIADKQSAGVHIVVNEWGEGNNRNKFIDVVCLKPHLDTLFDMIIFEILQELELTADDPGSACRKTLIKWREFLRAEPLGLPDKSSIVGIIGELILLRNLVKLNPSSIDIWTGPSQGRFDFYSDSLALEVKTTLQKRGLTVTIHGLSQLHPPASGTLYLAVLRLEEAPGAGETISSLVKELTSDGCDRIKLLTKLINVGINPDLIVRCDDYQFSLVENITYEVDGKFPSLTTDSFKESELPAQVVSLNYQIDLSSPPPFAMPIDQVQNVYRQLARGKGKGNA